MSAFFTDKDFLNSDVANQVLEARAIKGFAQKHRGEWSFTERQMKGDTHQALLLNLGEIEPCAHEVYKVTRSNKYYCSTDAGAYIVEYRCECGQEMEIGSFVEKKK